MRPTKPVAQVLLEWALGRRMYAYMSVVSLIAMGACVVWALVPFLVGWRVDAVDVVSAAAFGLATAVLLGVEHMMQGPGYFAGRQPWRRGIATSVAAAIASGALGAAMGACAGAHETASLGVGVAGAGAGAAHGIRRFLVRGWNQPRRFQDIQLTFIVGDEWRMALKGAAVATLLTLWYLGAARSTAVVVYAAAVHAWFAVGATAAIASAGLQACAVQPLNFKVAVGSTSPNEPPHYPYHHPRTGMPPPQPQPRSSDTTTRAAELLVFALGLGDVAAPDDAELRRLAGARGALLASNRSRLSQRGFGGGSFYTAAAQRDPFADGSGFLDATAPTWRREIEAQRFATFALLRRCGPADGSARSTLAPPPPMALASGGAVFGDCARYSFGLRLAKFLALRALATVSDDLSPYDHDRDNDKPLAVVLIQGRAGDAAVAKIIRSCLLVLDTLTFRVDLAAGADENDDVGSSTTAVPLATKFYEGRHLASWRTTFWGSHLNQKKKKKDDKEEKVPPSVAFGAYYFDDFDFATSPWGPGREKRRFWNVLDLAKLKEAVTGALTEAFNPPTEKPTETPPPVGTFEFERTPASRRRVLSEDLSNLECLAATFAVRATTNVFRAAQDDDDRVKDRVPLVLCSFLAAKASLTLPPDLDNADPYRHDLLHYLDAGLHLICRKYSAVLPTVAFPPVDADRLSACLATMES